jgi:acyl-CoA dehydrogenase
LRVAGDAVTRPAAGVDRPALHRRGALARAVVMAGAMERALDTAVTYAGERKQFGRPIGKFQAVQQNLAMNIVDRPGYLQLDEDDVFNE